MDPTACHNSKPKGWWITAFQKRTIPGTQFNGVPVATAFTHGATRTGMSASSKAPTHCQNLRQFMLRIIGVTVERQHEGGRSMFQLQKVFGPQLT
jgi:hypothetical protein